MTRRTRVLRVHATLGHGSWGKWLRAQLAAHGCTHTKSVVHRWVAGENVVDGELLEGVLRMLEADAFLKRLDDAEETIREIKGELR